MSDSKIPEAFVYGDFKLHSFSYEHSNRQFKVGQATCGLNRDEIFGAVHETTPDITLQNVSSTMLALGIFYAPITGPNFQLWLETIDQDKVFDETTKVMREVFSEMDGKSYGAEHDSYGFGFHTGLLRRGHLNLSVLGNCACLGVDPMGTLIDDQEWDTGFAEYGFHNIDTEAQHVSIMAGIGHLATKAVEL